MCTLRGLHFRCPDSIVEWASSLGCLTDAQNPSGPSRCCLRRGEVLTCMIGAVPCPPPHLVPFTLIVRCLALLQLSEWAPRFPRLSHGLEHASHLISWLFVLFLLSFRRLIVSRFLGDAFSDSTEEVSFSASHSCSVPYSCITYLLHCSTRFKPYLFRKL